MPAIEFFEAVGSTMGFVPGVEPVTGFTLIGLFAASVIGYTVSELISGEYTFRGSITPAGLVVLATMIAVDYWAFKGYTASTYFGDLLISNADLLAFFAGLTILLRWVEADLPGKYAAFKKVISA